MAALSAHWAQSRASLPIMQSVRRFADFGRPGDALSATASRICAKLCLLPGALMRNAGLSATSACEFSISASRRTSPRSPMALRRGRYCCMPIGHMEGNYFCDAAIPEPLQARGPHRLSAMPPRPARSSARGEITNGSLENIARSIRRGTQRARHDAPPGSSPASSCWDRPMGCSSSNQWRPAWATA